MTASVKQGIVGGSGFVSQVVSAVSRAMGIKRPPDPVDPIEAKLEQLETERAEILARPDYNPQNGRLHPEYEQLVRDGQDVWPHAAKDYGPLISIKASCFSCGYYRLEEVRRSVTDEADTYTRTNTCQHPKSQGRELCGSENTPTWCPYFAEYLNLHVGRLVPAAG